MSEQAPSKEQVMGVVGWLTHFLGCVRTDLQRENEVTKIFPKDAVELQKALDILETIAYPQAASAPEPLQRLQRPFTTEEAKAYRTFIEEHFEPASAPPPVLEWQPIETAPRDGTVILLAANTHRPDGKPRISSGHYSTDPYIGGANDEVIGAEEGFKGDGDECIPSNQECFTHWAPIPAFTPTKGGAQ